MFKFSFSSKFHREILGNKQGYESVMSGVVDSDRVLKFSSDCLLPPKQTPWIARAYPEGLLGLKPLLEMGNREKFEEGVGHLPEIDPLATPLLDTPLEMGRKGKIDS